LGQGRIGILRKPQDLVHHYSHPQTFRSHKASHTRSRCFGIGPWWNSLPT
jgi:hypothetical protein